MFRMARRPAISVQRHARSADRAAERQLVRFSGSGPVRIYASRWGRHCAKLPAARARAECLHRLEIPVGVAT